MDEYMRNFRGFAIAAFIAVMAASPAAAFVQFPHDIDNIPYENFPGMEDMDWNGNGTFDADPLHPNAVYKHLGAGDGFSKMADGKVLYTFGFVDLTGVPQMSTDPLNPFDQMTEGVTKANIPAPTIDVKEGQEFYLTLSNVGMKIRPDLFDPHTVHWHGFPNAASIFDGEPMTSVAVKMMHDLTYYYYVADPGTYMYHCHVEATEHMEMGMLGNLVVRPDDFDATDPALRYAYKNDGGSTRYDVEKLIQYSDFDPEFHEADRTFQPLPFAEFEIRYPLLNGRGYPDTVVEAPISNNASTFGETDYDAQKIDSKVTATSGQKILLRLSDLSIETFVNLEIPGLTFKVVGKCARLLRNPGQDGIMGNGDDLDLSYEANSVLMAPGETVDLIIDTAGVPTGTYFLYARNLKYLNNDQMDRGGAMTEIVIN